MMASASLLRGTHGVVRDTLVVGGFAIARVSHAGGVSLPWHTHADPVISYVVEGGFREVYRRWGAQECGAGTLLFKSGDESHANQYALSPTRSCLIDSLDGDAGGSFPRRS